MSNVFGWIAASLVADRKDPYGQRAKLTEKSCYECKAVKPIAEFAFNTTKGRYCPRCRTCQTAYWKEHRGSRSIPQMELQN